MWARSLVDEAILEHAGADAELVASDDRTHDDVVTPSTRRGPRRPARGPGASGDPTLYGALDEQIDACRRLGLSYEIVPGSARWPAPPPRSGRS